MVKTEDILVISNIVFEPYLKFELKKKFSNINKYIRVTYMTCEECMNFENKETLDNADIIVVCLNVEGMYPTMFNDICSNKYEASSIYEIIQKECEYLYSFLKKSSKGSIIWIGCEDYGYEFDSFLGTIVIKDFQLADKINSFLIELIEEVDTFIDFKKIIAKIGICRTYNKKNKYRWNSPYSKEIIVVLSEEIYKHYLIKKGITKKCIVLDCDNVLWEGILEEGVDKIKIKNCSNNGYYYEFQKFLLSLYYHGVILTVCSKNDEDDVLKVFRYHNDMILKEEHIACFKVNWKNKIDNIMQISNEINIGLESMVFIDDSEFEINAVKKILPKVEAILYDKESIYSDLSCFNLKSKIDINTIAQRNLTYKTNILRERLKCKFQTYEEFLEALDTKVEISVATTLEISRISELSQRTNKCTNGIRYNYEELRFKLKNANYKLYSIKLTDKFSNLGLVGAIGIYDDILDLFTLSCRALGRNVENIMIEHIVSNYCIKNFKFNKTGKNKWLIALFEKNFKRIDN